MQLGVGVGIGFVTSYYGAGGSFAPANTIVASRTIFSYTGMAAILSKGSILPAAVGAFAMTGVAAALATGHTLTADPAGFAMTGIAAGLNYTPSVGSVLTAAAGGFAMTGIAANLVYTPASAANVLTAATGNFAMTGVAANLSYGRTLPLAAGAFAMTGIDMLPVVDYTLPVAAGGFAMTGVAVNLTYTPFVANVLAAASGSFAMTGLAANLVQKVSTLPAAGGSFSMAGQAANLVYAGAGGSTPTLDGHAVSAAGDYGGNTTGVINLTTATANDLIVVVIAVESDVTPHATITSVSATGLTFTKRSSVYQDSVTGQYGATWNSLEVWSAVATGALTALPITVVASKVIDCGMLQASGWKNNGTTPPVWTSNVSLPATVGSTATSAPTLGGASTNKASVLLGMTSTAADVNQTAGSGFTLVDTGNNPNGSVAMGLGVEYKSNAASISSQTVTFGTSYISWSMIIDAIEAP